MREERDPTAGEQWTQAERNRAQADVDEIRQQVEEAVRRHRQRADAAVHSIAASRISSLTSTHTLDDAMRAAQLESEVSLNEAADHPREESYRLAVRIAHEVARHFRNARRGGDQASSHTQRALGHRVALSARQQVHYRQRFAGERQW
ncbi:hypothetical protein JCM10207_005827 [Rhodosporidiobolus poonsookiae]